MSDLEHLLPVTRSWLTLGDEERIYQMNRDLWIGYPQAKIVLSKMEELFAHPRISRMPNMLLVGRTNNGKTQILRRFQELHPASDNVGGEAISVPVLFVQTPSTPDERRLYETILDTLFAKYSYTDKPSKLYKNVKDMLEQVGVRLLIMDEIHNVVSGTLAQQRKFLTQLKCLCNETRISIVAAGTEDAVRALQTEDQLSNRFIPVTLPRWGMDADFRRMLASWEQLLPLRHPSALAEKKLAHEIWTQSEGTIGEVTLLLKTATKYAIREKIEKIDVDVIARCGYEKPSARKKRLLDV
jgi:hypothetical protein